MSNLLLYIQCIGLNFVLIGFFVLLLFVLNLAAISRLCLLLKFFLYSREQPIRKFHAYPLVLITTNIQLSGFIVELFFSFND